MEKLNIYNLNNTIIEYFGVKVRCSIVLRILDWMREKALQQYILGNKDWRLIHTDLATYQKIFPETEYKDLWATDRIMNHIGNTGEEYINIVMEGWDPEDINRKKDEYESRWNHTIEFRTAVFIIYDEDFVQTSYLSFCNPHIIILPSLLKTPNRLSNPSDDLIAKLDDIKNELRKTSYCCG